MTPDLAPERFVGPFYRVGLVHSDIRDFTKAEVGVAVPRNMLRGLHELTDNGRLLHEIFPSRKSRMLPIALRWLMDAAGRRQRRRLAAELDVIVVRSITSLLFVAFDSLLAHRRIPVFWAWAGFNYPWARKGLGRLKSFGVMYAAMRTCTAILPNTSEEARALDARFPSYGAFHVLPLGIDKDFYRPRVVEQDYDVIIVGNNQHRDWAIVSAVARRLSGRRFLVVSQSHDLADGEVLSNLELRTGETLASSRELLWRSRLVWVPTRANSHFSGVTTILMGMACEKAVLFDDEAHIGDFGLLPDDNCILVRRGDVDDTCRQIEALLEDSARHTAMGQAARRCALDNSSVVMALRWTDRLAKAGIGPYREGCGRTSGAGSSRTLPAIRSGQGRP